MKSFKKELVISLIILALLSLSGCGENKEVVEIKETETNAKEVINKDTKLEENIEKEETKIEEKVEKDVTALSYWVNFLNYDGTVISRGIYNYNETPTPPENVTYYDDVCYYNFLGWDKQISPVHGTQTYVAQFEKTGYVNHEEMEIVVENVKEPVVTTLADFLNEGSTITFYIMSGVPFTFSFINNGEGFLCTKATMEDTESIDLGIDKYHAIKDENKLTFIFSTDNIVVDTQNSTICRSSGLVSYDSLVQKIEVNDQEVYFEDISLSE